MKELNTSAAFFIASDLMPRVRDKKVDTKHRKKQAGLNPKTLTVKSTFGRSRAVQSKAAARRQRKKGPGFSSPSRW